VRLHKKLEVSPTGSTTGGDYK